MTRDAEGSIRGAVLPVLALVALGTGVSVQAQTQGIPAVTMRMLLERTFFRIDVLTLQVRVEGESARALRGLVRETDLDARAADSAAMLVTDATSAYARLDFLRGFSTGLFLDGIRENAADAHRAGVIDQDTRDYLVASLPSWYSFLEGRGVREGDWMEYFIRGDTLTVHYRANDGSLLLDQTDVGPLQRRSVLGGWVAPGSDFREGLIESLFDVEE